MHDDEEDTNAIEAESSDGFDGDSAYAGSSAGSLTETLASTIARGIEEHGRTYAAYGNEEYGLPIDEEELDRIDMSHAKYSMLLEKRLFVAPINPQPQRVLDIGTGTGIWAIEMADKYPSAEVLGLDIAPTQPSWVPPNCIFQIDDVEMPWTLGVETFDYIHARDLLLSIRDWPRLVEQSFDHLKPGGYLELQCVYPRIRCDDGSTPPQTGLEQFSAHAQEASVRIGCPLDACTRYAEYMSSAGFEDVVEKRFKMPSAPWAKEKRMKLIGAFEMHNLLKGISGMSLRMFSKGYGWSREEIEVFLVQVRKDIQNLKYHTYYEFIVVYGRKPGGSGATANHSSV
ncbi:S-adenosyl-L-methionine-dependent methyltransferase [Mollisia scopiformis]|uniref:S-adenosyl-L-methionine-dependent methyltransferase n=1 Tax=Mollisia scopiformis TaxID=149040 RepID=A0A132B1M6_MOLSC|nr:S-adenosyl-L-methionine-dependent methyltransferase [Mollisia scopiformis]KUJ06286.1 S-adenosyl-L-methionine-dependent methyltransferase [Mollisia scopiformis]